MRKVESSEIVDEAKQVAYLLSMRFQGVTEVLNVKIRPILTF